MIQILEKAKCVGCYACYSCCPLECITMEADNEGFSYPRVDQDVCIDCRKCEKVCPIIQKPALQSFSKVSLAAYSKNEQIRNSSSSGGVFSALAQIVLKHGGVIFGAAFDTKFQVHHIGVNSIDDLEKLRGSKYVQSRIENTYKEAKNILESGRKVYFSGTPCQIDGFKNYLGRDYDNLITQDIICHGVPAPFVWGRYLDSVREKMHSEVKHVSFRDKVLGWRKYSVKIEGANGKVEMSTFLDNPMMKAYLRDMCLRPSCYNCPSKGMKRSSDLTLADFWNISEFIGGFDDNRGTDLIICHTSKGLELLNEARPEIVCQEVNMRAAYENVPLNNSSELPADRDKFIEFLNQSTFTAAVKKYCSIPMYERIITRIKLISKKISRRK